MTSMVNRSVITVAIKRRVSAPYQRKNRMDNPIPPTCGGRGRRCTALVVSRWIKKTGLQAGDHLRQTAHKLWTE